MAPLEWDKTGERLFEAGVDRGVLYLPNGDAVVWNGLTQVESETNTGAQPYFMDGVKQFDTEVSGDFSAQISAFTYPDAIDEVEVGSGLFTNGQRVRRFGLCYRTRVGDDIQSTDRGYQIHLVYNLVLLPGDFGRKTLSDTPEATEFSWKGFATPVEVTGFKPTAHFIFHSDELDLSPLEDLLYGSDEADPVLPTIPELLDFMGSLYLTVTDNLDGTWTVEGPDEFITVVDGQFTIENINGVFLDEDTYEISSTE